LLRFELLPGTVEPDPETARLARMETARVRPGAAMFANRLRKNLARLEAWARREDVVCFRTYDADMPEYAFAVDLYSNDERWACVQEYAAPATVAQDAARARRDEALSVLPEVLGLPRERIVLRVRRRQRHGEQYEKVGEEAAFHTVREDVTASSSTSPTTSTRVVPDHRLTRQRVGQLAAGRRFLNLFAYTAAPRSMPQVEGRPPRPPSTCQRPTWSGPSAILR
jgi:23S rRNA (guanine2445-N2)-methyltransferase / 23S rRNA (guanine2069-N7)-methyltransferase